MKTIQIMTIAAGALLFSGCDVKDPIYNTPHPEKAKVTVMTDWSGLGEGITKPSAYTVEIGSYKAQATGDKHTVANLFDPGKYTARLYNEVASIPVADGVATVKNVTPFGRATGTYVEADPDWLFTGVLEADLEKDKDHEFTAAMQQQVRRLTLEIEPSGGAADRVESITASLSGVAGTMDIAKNTYGTPSNVYIEFVKDTDGIWKASVRLLGIAGSQQKLTVDLSFTGGTPAPVSQEFDVTTQLSGFNTNKKEPVKLGGEMVETPTEAGFTATIKEWTVVKGSGTAD